MTMRHSKMKAKKKQRLVDAARIDHAEDVIFWEGSTGALRALAALQSLEEGKHSDVTVKFDGSPAVVFGRNEAGAFVFTDKSGFSAKGYDGKATSPDMLESMFMNRGSVAKSESYLQFIKNMKEAYPVFEQAVPADYRGYVKGDLLYFNTPILEDNYYRFVPNVVEYRIRAESSLGKQVGLSKAGVVIHSTAGSAVFEGTSLLVLPPVIVQHPPSIDKDTVNEIKTLINKNAVLIDSLLHEGNLRANKLADLHKLFYAYTNSKVDTGLSNLGEDFAQWITNNHRIRETKKINIHNWILEHKQGLAAKWEIVSGIMNLKDSIVNQFDKHDSDIIQSINGISGGEGYVMEDSEGSIKLVPRAHFTRANRAIIRN